MQLDTVLTHKRLELSRALDESQAMRARRASTGSERRKNRDKRGSAFTRREWELARLAAGSESVVDHDELRGCGFSQDAIDRRVRSARLHRIHEGVYAVGHPSISLKGRFIAAVKACRPHGSLSHRAEGARSGFLKWRQRDIEVTVPIDVVRAHKGIQIHRSRLITRGDTMIRDGISVTNVTWTVVALAAVLSEHELRAAVRDALGMQLTSVRSILALLDRLGPVRGAGALRKIIARGTPRTRSELEDVVLDLIVAGGFEIPEVNEPLFLEGRKVVPDFRWPKQKVVIEADGSRWHDDPISHGADLERQALLERHGEVVVRVRWDEAIMRSPRTWRRFAVAGAPLLAAQ